MSVNDRIVESGYRVLRGELTVPRSAGLCLQMVRLVVEDACDLAPYGFYRWRTHVVERAATDDDSPWARDMERSLKAAGMAVAEPTPNPKTREDRYVSMMHLASVAEPGDLLFRWDVAQTRAGTWIGHVGILMPGNLVLENIAPSSRPESFQRQSTSLTPIQNFRVTLAARFLPS